jgi:hypothetical protein
VLELLNEEFPSKLSINPLNGKTTISEDNFTCYGENSIWNICCTDYWIYESKEFKYLKNKLLVIFKQNSIKVKFSQVYIVTQIIKKKDIISNKNIFIGKVKSTIQ